MKGGLAILEARGRRQEKIATVQELHEKFEKAGAVVLTDFIGLNVAQINEIRRSLRKSGAEYKVVKNTLARRAAEGTGVKQVEQYFEGPTGVVIGYDDIVAPFKVISDYVKKYEPFKVRIGVLEGTVVEPEKVKEIANLPPRDVLISKAIGGIKGPLYGLAGTLQALLTGLVVALKQVAEKKEKEGKS